MRFTVFTPTFNRAYCLDRVYQSLRRQTFKDFEWIIIDDGSTDNTEDCVAAFQAEASFFPIHYRKVQNGGKHRANNLAVRMAQGELFTCVDSDDYLTDDALEIADHVEKSIPAAEKQKFAGVCGQKGHEADAPLRGSYISSEYSDLSYLERLKHKIYGDCSEVFYTSVLKQFPYHEYEGETFLTEATAQFEMAAAGLKLRFFNNIIKIIEYLPDGLTANSKDRFRKNPMGWGLYIFQRIQCGLLQGFGKWEVITDYYDSCRARMRMKEIAKVFHMKPLCFRLRMAGMHLIYRIYQ